MIRVRKTDVAEGMVKTCRDRPRAEDAGHVDLTLWPAGNVIRELRTDFVQPGDGLLIRHLQILCDEAHAGRKCRVTCVEVD
jgi:hypothetical protein